MKERADLQELISDISHQVKNANQQSKNGKCHAAGTTHAREKAAGVFAGFQRPARKAGFSHAGHDNHHADRYTVCTKRDERVQTNGRLSSKIELRGKHTTTHGKVSRRLLPEFKAV